MIVVIVAGGSGTRLWPLSTPDHPKHLLKLDGDNLSLLQHTYERAKRLTDKIFVVSEIGHIDKVKQQLNELDDDHFIVEPARRGTASCIIAALVHIEHRHEPDEPIAFMHADHYIRNTAGFVRSFRIANEVTESEKRIVLIGVEPDYPATGLGYMQKGDVLNDKLFVYNVDSFKEKPEFDVAKTYIESGNYLWNCGYFVGSIDTFKKSMQTYAPELYANFQKLANASDHEEYEKVYLSLENIAIDYALMEKVPNLLVVPALFDWMDLGSFSDLHKAIGGNKQGNYIYGSIETNEVTNSFLSNEEDKPIVVIGLDNVVVVNSPSGILIARKDLAHNVGEISKKFIK